MYAVIRAGGKQYRVAPGDVIRIEKTPAENGNVEFTDVIAVSPEQGKLGRAGEGARVVGSVVEEGRGDKILVFHYKRKKQYKKLAGHRQAFTAVRITEIAFDGQRFTAPELPAKAPKRERPQQAAGEGAETAEAAAPAIKAGAKGKGGSRATGKKSAGKSGSRSAKKQTGSKKKPENR
jgi:large subunit ribosomal protein L21